MISSVRARLCRTLSRASQSAPRLIFVTELFTERSPGEQAPGNATYLIVMSSTIENLLNLREEIQGS